MLQEFVLSGAREAAEEVGAMKEPADTSRAEETVSLPLPSLRDSDRFPTPTLSRCRHGSTFLSPVCVLICWRRPQHRLRWLLKRARGRNPSYFRVARHSGMIRNKCRVCERQLRLCRLPGTNAPNFLEAGFGPTAGWPTIDDLETSAQAKPVFIK